MRLIRLAVAAGALAAAGLSSAPASAFPCSAIVNTGEQSILVGTVQVCSEGVRVIGTEVTTVVQVGVRPTGGTQECVAIARVLVGLPSGVKWDPHILGTPLSNDCPG